MSKLNASHLFISRPMPEVNESMLSWLHRLSEKNGYHSPLHLLRDCGTNISPSQDLDLIDSDDVYSRLATRMGLEHDSRIRETSLCSFVGSLVSDFPRGTFSKWILNRGALGNRYGGIVRYVICPTCLKEEGQYLRKQWRLSLATTCAMHRIELIDSCPNCDSPFELTSSKTIINLDHCANCHEKIVVRRRVVGELHNHDLTSLVEGIGNNSIYDFPIPLSYEFVFWDGISVLIALLRSRAVALKLNAVDRPWYWRRVIKPDAKAVVPKFEALSLRERRDLLRVISDVLQGWPNRFVKLFREAGITQSHVTALGINPPLWLDSVILEYLSSKKYSVTAQEVTAAITMLNRTKTRISKKRVRDQLGVFEGKGLDLQFPKRKHPLSTRRLGLALQWLEQQIDLSTNIRAKRASCIRDALAIAFCSVSGKNFEFTVRLNVEDALAVWQGAALANPKVFKIIAPHAARWFQEYVSSIRPQFVANGVGTNRFFATRFGTGCDGHGLPKRLADALRAAKYPNWQRGCQVFRDLSASHKPREPTSTLSQGSRRSKSRHQN
jgi:hypothetical protein